MALKKEVIGTTHYSKKIDSNLIIEDGKEDLYLSLEMYHLFEDELKEERPKKKKNDSDK